MKENARLERYHNTYKQRYKVMRGFKSPDRSYWYNRGFQTHYNFLREHSTLKMTSAEAAGIRLPLRPDDGWSDLIRWSTYWKTLREVN